jgi:hypothetical protein
MVSSDRVTALAREGMRHHCGARSSSAAPYFSRLPTRDDELSQRQRIKHRNGATSTDSASTGDACAPIRASRSKRYDDAPPLSRQ